MIPSQLKWLPTILILTGLINFHPLTAQEHRLRITAGPSMLIYQSAFSFQDGIDIETALEGGLTQTFDWQVGARVSLNTASPEGFMRLLMRERSGAWNPAVGLELGYTNRAEFDEDSKLLRETREAMINDIGKVYAGCHAAPLAFTLRNDWYVSAMEINFATHTKHIGRTLRLHVGAIRIGKSF